jgi:hypothetical protein
VLIDATPFECKAMESVLKPLGELVAEIGKDKTLDQYTREEVLRIISVCVSEYQIFMLKHLTPLSLDKEIPL